MSIKPILRLFCIFTLWIGSTAQTYYISSSTGSDSTGNGSVSTPFKTFKGAGLNVQNALDPGDRVLFKRGDEWIGDDADVEIYSSGTADKYIFMGAYGTGSILPKFTGSITTASLGAAFEGWVLSSGSIYYANTSPDTYIDWVPYIVGQDDNTVLHRRTSLAAVTAGSFYYDPTTKKLYVWCSDSANPSTHTMRIGKYKGQYVPLVRTKWNTTGAAYIVWSNLHVRFANQHAFGFAGSHNKVFDCLAELSGREGFYFGAYLLADADYGLCVRCVSSKNAAGGSGTGQGFTVETKYTWLIDSVAKDNFMAGFDWLGYNSQTDPSFGGCIRCISDHNGQNPISSQSWDPGFYVDGAHDLVFLDCIWKNQGGASGNQQAGFAIGSEHPTTNPTYNIKIINGLGYDNPGQAVFIGTTGPEGVSDVEVWGSTLKSSTYYRVVSVAADVTDVKFRNNIVYHSDSAPAMGIAGNAAPTYESDYNVFYNTHANGYIYASNGSNYTLANWLTVSDDDDNSIQANPLFVDVANNNLHLQAINTGHPADSPAINLHDPFFPYDYVLSMGATRSTNALDPMDFRDAGFHWLADSVEPVSIP